MNGETNSLMVYIDFFDACDEVIRMLFAKDSCKYYKQV